MKVGLIFIILSSSFISYFFISAFAPLPGQIENSAPLVRITVPLDVSKFMWNTLVNYSISVSDKEDGNSEYNEIAGAEVLLKVAYLPDSMQVKKYLADNSNTRKDPAAISLLMKSNCFTCHSVKNKLIGPSFDAIAKRYAYNAASLEALTKKAINGSSGVWGNTPMPAQPEINKEQVKEMVNWILENGADQNISYYTGIEGAFRTNVHPGKGVYVLTASYTDHGLKKIPEANKRGAHTIVLKPFFDKK